MRRSIHTIILAVPLALALTWGASAASALEPDAPAPVPWAPWEVEQPEDDSPVADVPWAPFEQEEVGPDLPEGQPEPDDDDIDPDPGSDAEPDAGADPVPDPQVAPVVEPRPIAPGTGKAAQEAVDETATASDRRAVNSPLVTVLIVSGFVLMALSIFAGIAALTHRRRTSWRG